MAKLAIDVVLNKAAAMTGLRGMEKDFMSFGKSLLGAVGIGGGLAGLVNGIDNILAKAGQLQDVSDAFNVSAESIQRLANVGVTANLSIEEIGNKLGKLGKAAQSAAGDNDDLAKTFAKIGVSGQELVSLSPEQLFNRLREAVSSGALAGEELKVVNDLLAKDFQRFLPILRMSTEEFERLGGASGVMSDAMVANLDAANVRVRQLQQRLETVKATLLGNALSFAEDVQENPMELFYDTGNEQREKRMLARERELTEKIAQERKIRAGKVKEVEDEAETERIAKAESRQALSVIDAEIKAREAALKMMANAEERFAKESLDRAKQLEEEKMRLLERRGELIKDIEQIQAERAGPVAELELAKRLAGEAGARARMTEAPEDVLAAEQAAQRVQQQREAQLSQAGYGPQAASMAKEFADSIVGALPTIQSLQGQQDALAQAAEQAAQGVKQMEAQASQATADLAAKFIQQQKELSLTDVGYSPEAASMAKPFADAIAGALVKIPSLEQQLADSAVTTKATQPQTFTLSNPPSLNMIERYLETLIRKSGEFN